MMNVRNESVCVRVALAVLFAACLACVSEEAVNGENGGNEKEVWTFNPAKLPEGYPLELVNAEVGSVKDLLDYECRPLKAIFKNRTGKDVVLKKILCGCPCLTLAKDYSNAKVPANGKLELDFSIDGHSIHQENFDRWMLFQINGFPEVFFQLAGNRVTKIRYEPARSINLGTFAGDVDWKRTIKIISDFEGDITLEQPDEHPLLKFEMKKTGAGVHELTIMPGKLPMKTGRIRANIRVQVKGAEQLTGVKQYGPLVIGVTGEVTGLKFALNRENFIMEREKIKEEGKGMLRTFVILREDKKSRVKMLSMHRENVKDLDSYFPVSKEEEEKRPLDELETWEKIAEDIQVELPEGVKLLKKAAERRIALEFEITPEYLEKAGKGFLQMPVTYQKQSVGTVQIRWR